MFPPETEQDHTLASRVSAHAVNKYASSVYPQSPFPHSVLHGDGWGGCCSWLRQTEKVCGRWDCVHTDVTILAAVSSRPLCTVPVPVIIKCRTQSRKVW